MKHSNIYLDYNATTPVLPEVIDAMLPFFGEFFGNPSSVHEYGIKARLAMEEARQQVAKLLNCYPDEIVFTSGGTEANNLAIQGTAFSLKGKGNHIITSEIEHPAVLEVCRYLATQGFTITYVPVDEFGMVDPQEIEHSIKSSTILITIMHANNETGTIQPIREISEIARRRGIVFHTDAAQTVGKIITDVRELGVDMLTLAGHKFYAPKGIGALFVKRGLDLQKLIHGADHEFNRRAGTENVPAIVGMGKAAEIVRQQLTEIQQKMKAARDHLENLLRNNLPDIKINGHSLERLPNTLNVSFRGIEGATLLSRLPGIAASAGAACHSDGKDISHVLKAMKVPIEFAPGTVRFSTGRFSTIEEMETAARIIIDTVRLLQPPENAGSTGWAPEHTIRLTQYARGLGCACKIRPQYLEKILHSLPPVTDPNVLVDVTTSDDAAVYKLNDRQAIVQTVDILTPVVDDPYHFGAIAAANALSDIYAMGGKPLFALNIVAFPNHLLSDEILKKILKGAADKASEAGVSIVGGHSLEDNEPKFGMAVTGLVQTSRILRNYTIQPGDVLILTKPIGTGIISTAIKKGLASPEAILSAYQSMEQLNDKAALAMESLLVHAGTDITGFGLLGHLKEMAMPKNYKIKIYFHKVPLLPELFQLVMSDAVPGGTKNNLDFVNNVARWHPSLSATHKIILCDAQTSGGLLLSMPPESAWKYSKIMQEQFAQDVWVIGEVLGESPERPCEILVEP